ncbi:MAG: twin-arginine translocase subunit TatB [Candidatus Competibacteraceae bacterium]|nr:twin-arginine translocase subunit TatB [Candidatus Competibacteraceae bacterium]MCP5126716.1 twin-arginine translocase subunit TatB [Gammaproteobacteria bacterium]HRX70908.1 Sec-independent protein translocase protein TatB [Candidatus Competibacteraceae bacterium]
MFEIGFWELALIGIVAMIVVGPERLPGLARTAGLWLGKVRRMVADIKAEVDRELHLEEIKQSLREQGHLTEVNDIKKDLTNRVKEIQEDLQAEFDDPGPPPGWRPGAVSAPPPPDWQPPALSSPSFKGPPPSDEILSSPPPFEKGKQGGLILEKSASSESSTPPAAN